jgi:hypothetical protein
MHDAFHWLAKSRKPASVAIAKRGEQGIGLRFAFGSVVAPRPDFHMQDAIALLSAEAAKPADSTR